jgi:TIR domain
VGYKIFICYRRVNKEFARGIERTLVEDFGRGSVFLDTDEIPGGQVWTKKVLEVFEDEPVVVTLVTTRWNSRRAGKLRLLAEDDHVRFELEAALERGLPIVPVLYEPARAPKKTELPPTLEPLLDFQIVRFSNDRWNHDAGELARALKGAGVAPQGSPAQVKPQETELSVPLPSRLPNVQLPRTYSPSMFTESPEERKEREAKVKEERERKARARAEAGPFYARSEFWLAALVTVALGTAALIGAELLARTIADRWTSLPDLPLVAGVLLVVVWASARMGVSAAAYRDDPDRGTRVFYTRGLLGGYTLAIEDFEPIGLWAAFPIATVLSWGLARGLAWVPYYFLDWNYALVFWLVLAAYTLLALVPYVVLTLEETTDFL